MGVWIDICIYISLRMAHRVLERSTIRFLMNSNTRLAPLAHGTERERERERETHTIFSGPTAPGAAHEFRYNCTVVLLLRTQSTKLLERGGERERGRKKNAQHEKSHWMGRDSHPPKEDSQRPCKRIAEWESHFKIVIRSSFGIFWRRPQRGPNENIDRHDFRRSPNLKGTRNSTCNPNGLEIGSTDGILPHQYREFEIPW